MEEIRKEVIDIIQYMEKHRDAFWLKAAEKRRNNLCNHFSDRADSHYK
jgi:hypothetical protein